MLCVVGVGGGKGQFRSQFFRRKPTRRQLLVRLGVDFVFERYATSRAGFESVMGRFWDGFGPVLVQFWFGFGLVLGPTATGKGQGYQAARTSGPSSAQWVSFSLSSRAAQARKDWTKLAIHTVFGR